MEGQSIEIKIKKKPSHRQRFSRRRFTNIMISCKLKSKLGSLKFIVKKKLNASWKVSYADVISFLIEELENAPLSYPVNKFSIKYPTKSSRIRLSFPVRKTNMKIRYKIKSVTIK